jgi:hypothetical protein
MPLGIREHQIITHGAQQEFDHARWDEHAFGGKAKHIQDFWEASDEVLIAPPDPAAVIKIRKVLRAKRRPCAHPADIFSLIPLKRGVIAMFAPAYD